MTTQHTPTPGERHEYNMSDDQLNTLLNACKPVTYMVIGGIEPRSPQENANAAWEVLGAEMGFDSTTVLPVPGKGPHIFTAIAKAEGK